MFKSMARRVLRDEIEELEQDAFVRGIDSGFEVESAEGEAKIAYARADAYMDGMREGQQGNAHSYAQGYQQGYDDQGEAYNQGYDAGFEAGKSESYVPQDEAASLEDCNESLVDEVISEADIHYGFGYSVGYEVAKRTDQEIFDDAYKLGVNDIAITLRKALGADTFALITYLLERGVRG